MSKLKTLYEWSVISLSWAIVALTVGALWLQYLDGQIVNLPVIHYAPHEFGLPVAPHEERPKTDITHLTTKSVYKPGEMVEAYVDVDKRREEPGMLQWQLMDKRFYPYVARRGVVPRGHHHQVVPIEKIPLHIPSGQYHFSGTVTYEINFLRTVSIPLRTNCFQVVNAALDAKQKGSW